MHEFTLRATNDERCMGRTRYWGVCRGCHLSERQRPIRARTACLLSFLAGGRASSFAQIIFLVLTELNLFLSCYQGGYHTLMIIIIIIHNNSQLFKEIQRHKNFLKSCVRVSGNNS